MTDIEEDIQPPLVEPMADIIDFEEYKSRKQIEKQNCDHDLSFYPEIAEHLTVTEIREVFPRLNGPCPKGCGFNGIAYASKQHFVYGDW